jgi:chromosome segregation ATPase
MDATREETKRRIIQLQEEYGKLQEKLTSKETEAEQQKEKYRQRESELQKVWYNGRALDLGL